MIQVDICVCVWAMCVSNGFVVALKVHTGCVIILRYVGLPASWFENNPLFADGGHNSVHCVHHWYNWMCTLPSSIHVIMTKHFSIRNVYSSEINNGHSTHSTIHSNKSLSTCGLGMALCSLVSCVCVCVALSAVRCFTCAIYAIHSTYIENITVIYMKHSISNAYQSIYIHIYWTE